MYPPVSSNVDFFENLVWWCSHQFQTSVSLLGIVQYLFLEFSYIFSGDFPMKKSPNWWWIFPHFPRFSQIFHDFPTVSQRFPQTLWPLTFWPFGTAQHLLARLPSETSDPRSRPAPWHHLRAVNHRESAEPLGLRWQKVNWKITTFIHV